MIINAERSGQSSLLSLPRELRLNIYEHVFALDLDITIYRDRKKIRDQDRDTFVIEGNAREAMTVPWLNLMLTCKSTATELRALMRETSFLADEKNRTYVLNLEASRAGRSLGKATWRQLPCAPNHAEYLEAHVNASRGFRAVGDGGLHPIMQSLYQTLNSFVHSGPLLRYAKNPLPQPMHLKALLIVVESESGEERDEGNYGLTKNTTDPDIVALSLGSFVGMVHNTGVLKGYVDHIQLRSSQHKLNWAIMESEGTGIPDNWSSYGFEWGEWLHWHLCGGSG